MTSFLEEIRNMEPEQCSPQTTMSTSSAGTEPEVFLICSCECTQRVLVNYLILPVVSSFHIHSRISSLEVKRGSLWLVLELAKIKTKK